MTRRVAPGRSGRLLVRRRLAMSERAGELLHQKEEALRRERVRLRGHASRTQADWENSCTEVDRSVARVRLLGGAMELHEIAVAPGNGASVTCRWQTAMGVEYPGDVTLEPGPAPPAVATAAFGPAIDACRAALVAGAEHAAAALAVARIDHEMAETRRRRRAVTDRLVPRLREQLRRIEIELDESEREEALRTRLAVDRREARP
jgi:V/A-type H+-transporting ATPase subunit D